MRFTPQVLSSSASVIVAMPSGSMIAMRGLFESALIAWTGRFAAMAGTMPYAY